jgi:hypothetical protein
MITDDDVMFQGKWLDVYGDGSYLITDDLAKQIQDSPPKPSTLYGVPIIMDEEVKVDLLETGKIPNRDPNKHPQQCRITQATMIVHGLTRNGACPTIRNPKKDRP